MNIHFLDFNATANELRDDLNAAYQRVSNNADVASHPELHQRFHLP